MAKKPPKEEELDLSVLLDDEFDMQTWDFDEPMVKDDRKPVVKLASGMYAGAKQQVRDTDFLANLVKDTLPRGYGQTMDQAFNVRDSLKRTVDEAARELEPAKTTIKSTLTRLTPKESKLVPKRFQDKLDQWRQELAAAQATGEQQAQSRDEAITGSIAEVFGNYQAQVADQFGRNQTEALLRDAIGVQQHQAVMDQGRDTTVMLSSLDRFNKLAVMPFQKKSLEIQMRQLLAAQDNLAFMREDATRRDQYLANITKNTGLPEFVKLGNRENLHQIVRNKFLDTVNNGLFGDRAAAVERVLGSIRGRVVGAAKSAAQGMIMAGTEGAQAAEDLDRAGVDKSSLVGQMAGGELTKGALSMAGGRLRDRMLGSKLDERFGISDKGDKLESMVTAIPQSIEEFRRSDKWDFDNSLKGRLINAARTFIPSMGADMETQQVSLRSLDDPYHFTRKTDRSINEVIPGLLGRILHSVDILRTGDVNAPMIEYDHRKQRFDTHKATRDRAWKSIITPGGVEGTQKRLDTLLEELGAKDLSPEAQEALRERMFTSSVKSRKADANNLANPHRYEGKNETANQEAAEFMQKYLSSMTPRQQANFTRMHRDLVDDVGETRGAIQQEINLGNTNWLRENGLVDESGRTINMDRIIKEYLNAKNAEGAQTEAPSVESIQAKAMREVGAAARRTASDMANKAKAKVGDLWQRSGAADLAREAQTKAQPHIDPLKNKVTTQWQVSKDAGKSMYDQLRDRGYQYSQAPPATDFSPLVKPQKDGQDTPAPEAPQSESTPLTPWQRAQQWGRDQAQQVQGLWGRSKTQAKQSAAQAASKTKEAMDGAAKAATEKAQQAQASFSAKAQSYGSQAYQKGADTTEQFKAQWSEGPQWAKTAEQVKSMAHKAGEQAQGLGEQVGAAAEDLKAKAEKTTKQSYEDLKNAFKSMKQEWSGGEADLYVDGEKDPRMTAAKMKAGKYVDKDSGEPIQKVGDIKGEVLDEENNTVVSREDIPRLKRYSAKLGLFIPAITNQSLLGKIGRAVWFYQTKIAPKWVAFNYRLVKGAVQGVVKATKSTVQFLRGTNVRDVYVMGEQQPRLKAAKLKAGYYTHRKDGSVVYNQNDIKGEVIDENGATAISEDELDKLQVYNSVFRIFNPLKLIPWAIKGVGKLAVLGARASKWMATKAWEGLKWGAGKVKGLVYTGLAKLNPAYQPTDVYVKGQRKPSLLGKLMEAGKYFSRLTNKAISRPSEIDGDVVDDSGQVVLTEQEIKEGITNLEGKSLSTKLTSKVAAFGSMLKKAISMRVALETPGLRRQRAQQEGEAAEANRPQEAKGRVAKAKSMVDKMFGKGGEDKEGYTKPNIFSKLSPQEQQVSLLKDILGVFKRQESKEKRKNRPGYNADGSRVNGWQERRRQSAEKKKEAEDKKTTKKDEKSGGLMAGLAKLFGKKGEDKDGGMGLGEMLLARFGLGKLLAGGAAATTVAGTAGTVAAGTAAAGTAAAAGGTAAAAAASTAAAGAATVGTAGAATAAGGLAAGAASVLGAPLVIAGAAVAAGVYTAYKASQWLSTGWLNPMEEMRYVQYGFSLKETKYSKAVLALERFLMQKAKASNGKVELDDADVKVANIMDSFGLDWRKNDHQSLFRNWYQRRFRPVFITHLEAIHGLKGHFLLGQANGLDKKDKLRYVEATQMASGPYYHRALPIDETSYHSSGPDEVKTVIAKLKDELSEDNKDDKDDSASKEAKKRTAEIEKKIDKANKKNGSFSFSMRGSVEDREKEAMARVEKARAAKMGTMAGVAAPDAEPPPQGGSMQTTSDQSAGGSVGSLPMAEGERSDGREGRSFLALKGGVKIDQLNPEMLTNLLGMAQEYGQQTGKKIPLNDGHRTFEEQAAMKRKYGPRAAAPGNSLHEFGLAVDMDSRAADELEQLGLMRKYGFTRPVGGETWHVEPAGIQNAIDQAKRNPGDAAELVKTGLGKGGGGYGTVQGARQYGRNAKLAAKLLGAPSVANVKPKEANANAQTAMPSPERSPNQFYTANNLGGSGANYDGEASAKPNVGGSMATASGVGPQAPSLNVNADADPSAQVPQAGKGGGYEAVKDVIAQAAKLTGVPEDTMVRVAAIESGFNAGAKASTSSASGLFQFTKGTWQETLQKYGSRYGFDGSTTPMDPRANAMMAGHYLADIQKGLKNTLGRAPTTAETYMGHFLGPGGARQFLKAMQQNPEIQGSQLMPKAAGANKPIFFENGRNLSLREIFAKIEQKVQNKAKSFGIESAPAAPVDPEAGVETPAAQPQKPQGLMTVADKGGVPPMPKAAMDHGDTPAGLPAGAQTPGIVPSLPEAVRQSRERPMAPKRAMGADMFSFDHEQMIQPTQITQDPKSLNRQDPFGVTNRLLTDILEVNRETRDFMKRVADRVDAFKPAEAPAPAAPAAPEAKAPAPGRPKPTPLKMGTPPVNMGRMV